MVEVLDKIRKILRPFIPEYLRHRYRYIKYPEYREYIVKKAEFDRIRRTPRFIEITTELFNKTLKIVDSASFIFIYKELFEQEIYKFKTNNTQPYIIDAGANIGLATIYFKELFPDAKIIAFEPDPKVFKVLKENIKSFDLEDVTLVPKVLWDEETTMDFFQEGADGGRVATSQDTAAITERPTTRLRQYLQEPVDFLKLDIEGAETRVLKDCQDLLSNVERIFVEYHSFKDEKQTLNELLEILTASGFKYYISHIGIESRQPLLNKNTFLGMDNQLNIYATREN